MRIVKMLPRLCPLLMLSLAAAWAPFAAAPDTETIATLALDCATPKTVFTLGESVCAVAIGAPLEPAPPRRFEWIAPDGAIFQLGPNVVSDPDSNSITLPASGTFAQPGIWTVKTVDVSNNGFAVDQFLVQDTNRAAADLSASMFAPFQVSAGSNITFTLLIKNNGPNQAQNVQIKIGAASNATLFSAEQTSGPPFTGQSALQAANGNGVCAIETLPVKGEAAFVFVYHIGPGTPNGASVSSTAMISSSTFELNPTDNVGTATSNIAPQPCVLGCPAPVTIQKQTGQCGAVVSYATPAQTGTNCGALVCNPAAGSVFPLGTTSVICVGDSGAPCSFTVTVDDLQHALTCPSGITITEDTPGMGLAVVKYKSPFVNDTCAADPSACSPPSGSSFPVGSTTVTCDIPNSSGTSAPCSFTVTVESSSCSLSSPSSIAVSNKANECGAVVNYPGPKTDGDCGSVRCTPPSGSFFPVGETAVSCTTSSGSGSTFKVTVQDTQAPVITRISANPSSLLPLNGKMADVKIDYVTANNCSGEESTCTLSVSSTELRQKDSPPDWEIIDPHHVKLRADRGAKGDGRVYSITVTCADSQGNLSSEKLPLVVRRDR